MHCYSEKPILSLRDKCQSERLHDQIFPTWLRQAGSHVTFCSKLNTHFLANVNSRSRSLCAVARLSVCLPVVCLSVVCNTRAPYSGG